MKNKNVFLSDEDYLNALASVTEFTGFIQIPPKSEEEAENYSEIFGKPVEKNDLKNVRPEREKGVILEKEKVKV